MKMNIVVVLTLAFILSACQYSNEPVAKADPDDIKQCTTDSQCITVASSCCGCTAGGKNMAINKSEHAQWLKDRASNCKDTICPAVISQDESCSATAVCVKGQCELSSSK